MDKVFTDIDANKAKYIERLGKAISFKTVSCDVSLRGEHRKFLDFIRKEMGRLGLSVEECPLPKIAGLVDPPGVIFARSPPKAGLKTLLIYGHLDVQPAKKCDGWTTDPFTMTESTGIMYGRGSTDDKGPVMGWLNAIESMKNGGLNFPVNIRFLFESMEEVGSPGLVELLKARPSITAGVDFVCVSDNYWLGTYKPCLTYGLRGVAYFFVTVSGPSADLHSGSHGGAIREPLVDLIWLMAQLNHGDGTPNISGLSEMVAPLKEDEKKRYTTIEFNAEDYRKDIGATLSTSNNIDLLMRRWRFPSLSLHGIEGAYSDCGSKTVIPGKVIGKFSIRLVPNMKGDAVVKVVKAHIDKLVAQRGIKNNVQVECNTPSCAWIADTNSPNYQAAHKATKQVYGVDPDYTREGGSIPITMELEALTGASVVLLPIGAGDDGAHSQNEKLDVRNFIQGSKLQAAYIAELGNVK